MSASKADWARVGAMLENRRAELDPRYRNMKIFERERGIDYRLAWDIEHTRRDTYRRITLTAIEVAYGWQPGSIRRVLEGGDPVLAAGTPGAAGAQQQELSATEAEALGREIFRVIQGGRAHGTGENAVPQAILDIVRAAAGRKRRQGNGTQGA